MATRAFGTLRSSTATSIAPPHSGHRPAPNRFVRDPSRTRMSLLFDAVKTFELAAAFECCRINYVSSNTPYDASGFFRGWELQTGVMAYRTTSRVAAFWAAAADEFMSHRTYWASRSSGEQGAATLALSRVDVRFLPLPPSFNARPYTMLQYLRVFGVPIYHGKGLWEHKGLDGRDSTPEEMVRERMLRDWDGARDVLASEFPRSDGATDSDTNAECLRRCASNSQALGTSPTTSAAPEPKLSRGSRWPVSQRRTVEGRMASIARRERPTADRGQGRHYHRPILGRRLAEPPSHSVHGREVAALGMEYSWRNSTTWPRW